jgi:hypothetical protein
MRVEWLWGIETRSAHMATQDYSIRFTVQQGLLRVHVLGVASLQSTFAYWTEIVERVCALKPHSLLLIDELRGPPLSAADWFGLVQALGGKGLESVRIAHVKPHGLEQVEYCEIYAKEAGLDARVFVDPGAAELWLRHGERERPAERGRSSRNDLPSLARPGMRRG